MWVGGVSAGALSLLPYTLIDASIWAYAGFIYYRYYHNGQGGKVKRFLVAWILAEPIHQLFWMMTYWIMKTRADAILAVSWRLGSPRSRHFLRYPILVAERDLSSSPLG